MRHALATQDTWLDTASFNCTGHVAVHALDSEDTSEITRVWRFKEHQPVSRQQRPLSCVPLTRVHGGGGGGGGDGGGGGGGERGQQVFALVTGG